MDLYTVWARCCCRSPEVGAWQRPLNQNEFSGIAHWCPAELCARSSRGHCYAPETGVVTLMESALIESSSVKEINAFSSIPTLDHAVGVFGRPMLRSNGRRLGGRGAFGSAATAAKESGLIRSPCQKAGRARTWCKATMRAARTVDSGWSHAVRLRAASFPGFAKVFTSLWCRL